MSEDQSSSEPRSIDDASGTESVPPKQRRYRKAYKLRLIELADACTGPSELASLLLKENVHSSTLAEFRRQKARGILELNSDKVAGAKASVHDSSLLKQLAASNRSAHIPNPAGGSILVDPSNCSITKQTVQVSMANLCQIG